MIHKRIESILAEVRERVPRADSIELAERDELLLLMQIEARGFLAGREWAVCLPITENLMMEDVSAATIVVVALNRAIDNLEVPATA